VAAAGGTELVPYLSDGAVAAPAELRDRVVTSTTRFGSVTSWGHRRVTGRPNPARATARAGVAVRTATSWDTAQAVVEASRATAPGDVMLLEAQAVAGDQQNMAVETEQAVLDAIGAVTRAGIVVVEAGGSGGHDLDTVTGAAGGTTSSTRTVGGSATRARSSSARRARACRISDCRSRTSARGSTTSVGVS
jgi:hypothetical protein